MARNTSYSSIAAGLGCFALLMAIATAQVSYNNDVRFWYPPTSSYCYVGTTPNGPLTCVGASSVTQATVFYLTGWDPTIASGAYAMSPTIPAILDGGSVSKWCWPKTYTGNANNTIYCSGATTTGWFQLLKVGGLADNYLWNLDSVVMHSTLTNTNCSIANNIINCDPSGSASPAVFTIVI